MPRIHLIEDDAAFRKSVEKILSLHGFDVSQSPSGRAGIISARKSPPDLVILDLVMPGLSGQDVCQALKQNDETAGVPILVLTGNDKEGQEIACLDMGADDYLIKPVGAQRLLARCRALLRRVRAGAKDGGELHIGPLRLDYERKIVLMGQNLISHLTPKEFELLYDIAARAPKPQDRETLYRQVWGTDPPSEMSLKTVEVHIRRLRLKMGWKSNEWLVTVTGRGYTLKPPKD